VSDNVQLDEGHKVRLWKGKLWVLMPLKICGVIALNKLKMPINGDIVSELKCS